MAYPLEQGLKLIHGLVSGVVNLRVLMAYPLEQGLKLEVVTRPPD